jgi:hypothetical protein
MCVKQASRTKNETAMRGVGRLRHVVGNRAISGHMGRLQPGAFGSAGAQPLHDSVGRRASGVGRRASGVVIIWNKKYLKLKMPTVLCQYFLSLIKIPSKYWCFFDIRAV